MISIEKLKQSHGRRVSFVLMGDYVDDAKISVNKGGKIYFCNNKRSVWNNGIIENKFGYEYAWLYDDDVKDIKFKPKTLRDIEVGDVLVHENGDERMVLGICGRVHLMSADDDFEEYDDGYTIVELIANGYKVKQDLSEEEPKTVSHTMEEVCEKFGYTVKIKK